MSLYLGGSVTSKSIENLLDLLLQGGRGFVTPGLTLYTKIEFHVKYASLSTKALRLFRLCGHPSHYRNSWEVCAFLCIDKLEETPYICARKRPKLAVKECHTGSSQR